MVAQTPKNTAGLNRMAVTIAELSQETGSCTETDLMQHGFTSHEIETHGQAARDLAAATLRNLAA